MQYSEEPNDHDIKALNIVWLGLLAGQLLFALIVIFMIYSGTVAVVPGMQEIFFILALVSAALGIMIGNRIFKSRLQIIKQQPSMQEKMTLYKAALITKLALFEGPSLFAIICYFITGDIKLLIPAGVIVLLFIMSRPSKEKIMADLGG